MSLGALIGWNIALLVPAVVAAAVALLLASSLRVRARFDSQRAEGTLTVRWLAAQVELDVRTRSLRFSLFSRKLWAKSLISRPKRERVIKAKPRRERRRRKPVRERLSGLLEQRGPAKRAFGWLRYLICRTHLERLNIHVTIAGDDPALVGIASAWAAALIDNVGPLPRNASLRVEPAFAGEEPKARGEIAFCIRIMTLAIIGWMVLWTLVRRKLRRMFKVNRLQGKGGGSYGPSRVAEDAGR
jgi:hypothetical protein